MGAQLTCEQSTAGLTGIGCGASSGSILTPLQRHSYSLLGGRTSTAGGKLLPWQLTALIANNQQLGLIEPQAPRCVSNKHCLPCLQGGGARGVQPLGR